VDIETSGLDMGKNGIWQIGALDLDNPSNQFCQECRIDNDELIMPEALVITGKTEEELRDKNKQSQTELILNFLDWASGIKNKMFVGQNVGFDYLFIQHKFFKYGLREKFHGVISPKNMDLHPLAQIRYKEVNGKFFLKENGSSDFSLSKICNFCGFDDCRRNLDSSGKFVKEGIPHDALFDAKISAECFSRLMYGKNLLEEFKDFKIPEYLKI